MGIQIPLDLPSTPRPLDEHFVPHSGVIEAYSELSKSLQTLEENPSNFFYFQLLGPAGSGTSHLLEVIRERVEDESRFETFDSPMDWEDQELVRRFIDAYERLKSSGGMLLVVNPSPTENPHVQSRLRGAVPLELRYPQEDELRPLVHSLLERRGLKFEESKLAYLLDRLPADPLSLSSILAKIDALSLIGGKQPTRSAFREVLSEFQATTKEAKEG